jgi:AcrR family transcriptional regulator
MGRPAKPLLSQHRIRDAALALIDEEGLEALSMRRLAQRLGVQAASLYSHVPTKEALLDSVADEVMQPVDVSGFAYDDWREALRRWAKSYRAALAAHPHAVPFVAYGPALREASLERADAVHGGLVAAGWPPRYATMIGASVKYLVVGAATTSFAHGFVDDIQVYLDRYPNLVQAHRLRKHAAEIDEQSFGLALDSLIAGLDILFEKVQH